MAKDGYPLAAARELRAREEDEAVRALAAATAALVAAEAGVAMARGALAAHDAETARTLARERTLDDASRTVADATLAHAWGARRRSERARHVGRVIDAERAEAAARAAASAAREALAEARAQREAVEKHHAKWLADARRGVESRAEAEAEDVLAGRRR